MLYFRFMKKKERNHSMLIAILGYRQVTCRETSKNSSRLLSVNSRTACFLAANIGGIQDSENKS